MESFGKYLRDEREKRGITIEQISSAIKVSHGQLNSIENDDFASLPPITFVRGFVRSYAKIIGLDSNTAILKLEQYLSEIEQQEEAPREESEIQFRRASPDPKILITTIVVFVSLLIIILLFAVKSCLSSDNATAPEPPSASSLFSPQSIDNASLANSMAETGVAEPILPTVPPQSFTITKTGRAKIIHTDDNPINSDGGGVVASEP